MKALLHYPTFFICIACIFCISSTNFDTADAIRRCTALVSAISLLLGYCFWLLMKGPSIQIPTDKILKTFCLVGVFEILYSILQILGVINNHFHYHFFSGSFENPAILGMLLSFCISISYYYTIKSVIRRNSSGNKIEWDFVHHLPCWNWNIRFVLVSVHCVL